MLLSTRGWQRYHEFICSPGLPWDCKLHCALWRAWEWQRQRNAERPEPGTTWHDLERKG